ncbi:MAG: VanZ family protein, partial [Burkholderiales bacterium]
MFVTLNPFTDWRDIGIAPWVFLAEPWPRYWTWFDLLTNAAAYAPLGLLGALAVYPGLRGLAAFALVTAVASALSLSLEALQTYLPTRIASWPDCLANSLGAALG